MNEKAFYASVRKSLFQGSLKPSQFEGLQFILGAWVSSGLTDIRWLAYALATVYWETARTMQPIREYGRGRGRAYGKKEANGQTYYGRGYVQLTWPDNYRRASKKLGVDFYNNPDWVMQPKHAADIMFRGMNEGWFTSHSFKDHINDYKTDYEGARRIINGTDKRHKIAGIAEDFEKALRMGWGDVGPVETKAEVPKGTNWLTALLKALSASLAAMVSLWK